MKTEKLIDCPECGEGLVDLRGGAVGCLDCFWTSDGLNIKTGRLTEEEQSSYDDDCDAILAGTLISPGSCASDWEAY